MFSEGKTINKVEEAQQFGVDERSMSGDGRTIEYCSIGRVLE